MFSPSITPQGALRESGGGLECRVRDAESRGSDQGHAEPPWTPRGPRPCSLRSRRLSGLGCKTDAEQAGLAMGDEIQSEPPTKK